MTLLTLGLYLPLWFHYGLAHSPVLEDFIPFPAGEVFEILSIFMFVCICRCAYVPAVHTSSYILDCAQVLKEIKCKSMD